MSIITRKETIGKLYGIWNIFSHKYSYRFGNIITPYLQSLSEYNIWANIQMNPSQRICGDLQISDIDNVQPMFYRYRIDKYGFSFDNILYILEQFEYILNHIEVNALHFVENYVWYDTNVVTLSKSRLKRARTVYNIIQRVKPTPMKKYAFFRQDTGSSTVRRLVYYSNLYCGDAKTALSVIQKIEQYNMTTNICTAGAMLQCGGNKSELYLFVGHIRVNNFEFIAYLDSVGVLEQFLHKCEQVLLANA